MGIKSSMSMQAHFFAALIFLLPVVWRIAIAIAVYVIGVRLFQ